MVRRGKTALGRRALFHRTLYPYRGQWAMHPFEIRGECVAAVKSLSHLCECSCSALCQHGSKMREPSAILAEPTPVYRSKRIFVFNADYSVIADLEQGIQVAMPVYPTIAW